MRRIRYFGSEEFYEQSFYTRASYTRFMEELELGCVVKNSRLSVAPSSWQPPKVISAKTLSIMPSRERLEMLQRRIYDLEEQLRAPRFIEELPISCERVSIGTKVVCLDLRTRKEVVYTILGQADAVPEKHHLVSISYGPRFDRESARR